MSWPLPTVTPEPPDTGTPTRATGDLTYTKTAETVQPADAAPAQTSQAAPAPISSAAASRRAEKHLSAVSSIRPDGRWLPYIPSSGDGICSWARRGGISGGRDARRRHRARSRVSQRRTVTLRAALARAPLGVVIRTVTVSLSRPARRSAVRPRRFSGTLTVTPPGRLARLLALPPQLVPV